MLLKGNLGPLFLYANRQQWELGCKVNCIQKYPASFTLMEMNLILFPFFLQDIEDIPGVIAFSKSDFTDKKTQQRIISVLPSASADVIIR